MHVLAYPKFYMVRIQLGLNRRESTEFPKLQKKMRPLIFNSNRPIKMGVCRSAYLVHQVHQPTVRLLRDTRGHQHVHYTTLAWDKMATAHLLQGAGWRYGKRIPLTKHLHPVLLAHLHPILKMVFIIRIKSLEQKERRLPISVKL